MRICFITAIYGSYETSCKRFAKQTVPADFICFTDNPTIKNNGWIIDAAPYHMLNKSPLDNDTYVNSIKTNKHTFNISKYYKQAFKNIPRLKDYDVVVWLDGTLEITSNKVAEYVLQNIRAHPIITWHHERRWGILKDEMIASKFAKYTNTIWNNQLQPFQDVEAQYNAYIADGYTEEYFKAIPSHTPHLGVWITCFLAFLNTEVTSEFLDLWYLQTLKHTTQDQIGFPYVCQKTGTMPYTLPNGEVAGEPHERTDFYIKHRHGI